MRIPLTRTHHYMTIYFCIYILDMRSIPDRSTIGAGDSYSIICEVKNLSESLDTSHLYVLHVETETVIDDMEVKIL